MECEGVGDEREVCWTAGKVCAFEKEGGKKEDKQAEVNREHERGKTER